MLKKYYTQSEEQDDLISIGTIGLIKGISTFRAREGRAPCDLRRPLRRKCYTIAAEQSAIEVVERVSFEAKWRLLATVGSPLLYICFPMYQVQ